MCSTGLPAQTCGWAHQIFRPRSLAMVDREVRVVKWGSWRAPVRHVRERGEEDERWSAGLGKRSVIGRLEGPKEGRREERPLGSPSCADCHAPRAWEYNVREGMRDACYGSLNGASVLWSVIVLVCGSVLDRPQASLAAHTYGSHF